MAVVTFSEAARLLGHKSRAGLYRARDDGRLAGYLAPGGLEMEPPGLPTLAQRMKATTRVHVRAAGHRLPAVAADGDGVPDYDVSRARAEHEKANLLEIERKVKEASLLPREQVERVQANVASIVKTRLLGVPSRARQRLPSLSLHDVAVLDELIREALEELSAGR